MPAMIYIGRLATALTRRAASAKERTLLVLSLHQFHSRWGEVALFSSNSNRGRLVVGSATSLASLRPQHHCPAL